MAVEKVAKVWRCVERLADNDVNGVAQWLVGIFLALAQSGRIVGLLVKWGYRSRDDVWVAHNIGSRGEDSFPHGGGANEGIDNGKTWAQIGFSTAVTTKLRRSWLRWR